MKYKDPTDANISFVKHIRSNGASSATLNYINHLIILKTEVLSNNILCIAGSTNRIFHRRCHRQQRGISITREQQDAILCLPHMRTSVFLCTQHLEVVERVHHGNDVHYGATVTLKRKIDWFT